MLSFAFESFDWGQTPLGPRASWSVALSTTYDIMMSSSFGMCATWGPEQTLLYNEAYAPFLGARHPWALGRPIQEVWPDVWADIEPSIRKVLAGESVFFQNQRLVMTRNGYEEETFWTYSYSPLRDEGSILGFLNVTTDTTDMVLAQRRAQVNAQRVQLALEAGAIIGTWFWHVPSDRFTVDEAFARSFGLPSELGHEGLSLEQVIATVHPDDRQGLIAAIEAALQRGGPFAHQYRTRRGDGRYAWLEANGRVERDANGVALNFPGVLIDVEERRAVEAERDLAIARLRALNAELEQKVVAQALARGRTWQLSPDMLCVINAQGYVEASNPAWQTVLGWSEDDVARAEFLDLVHPDDLAATRAAWDSTLDGGQPVLRLENRYRHQDGGWRWLSWVAVADDTKVYGSARDITEEKTRQADLVKRTAERDRLWEKTNDLMGTAALDGYLKAINPAWTSLLGWSEAELLGEPLSTLFVPAEREAAAEVLQRLAAGEEVTGFVALARCRDGSQRHIMWSAAPDPGTDLFLLVGRDMTELHEAEATLRQSQKMEAVGQLTGGLAHDFNNLLAGISGALELMSLRVRQGRLGEVENYIGVAQGAAKRAAVLTHRLLAFSRRQTLAPKPTHVTQIIAGMVDMIQRTVGPSILVEHLAAADLWATLVDVSQLENALLNLCLNARDAMPSGGRITIQTQNRWLDRAAARQLDVPAGPYLAMSVTDTGLGMTPDVMAKAFDPFFTTKPLGQGTGLGLSMIYGFAKQSGGQVRIESQPGQGTGVEIYLPRHAGETVTEPQGSTVALPAASAGQRATILVVDDEPTVRLLVVDVLEELGYTVLQAGDAAGGLEVLQSDTGIDLLVSDVGLPGGMNGRQMVDVARVSRPQLPVLFITGYAENSLLTDGQLAPGTAVLTKPFGVDVLASRVRELIAR